MEGMYQAHVIAPNVYHIEEKLANPGFMTLVVGMQRALLFDTGYGSGDLRSFVASLTDKSIEVVLSHGHGDHVGNAWQFGEVWIHPKDDAICRAAHSVESRAARWGRNTRYKDQAPDIPRGRGYYDYVNPGLQDLHLKYLEDGQTFDLGGKTAEVFWMPGHTEGEIGMFLREDRIFLTGDCANPTFFLFTCDQTNAEDHIRNLKRLLQLPFDHFVIGHRPTLFPKEKLQEFLFAMEKADPTTDRIHLMGRFPDETILRSQYGSDQDRNGVYVLYRERQVSQKPAFIWNGKTAILTQADSELGVILAENLLRRNIRVFAWIGKFVPEKLGHLQDTYGPQLRIVEEVDLHTETSVKEACIQTLRHADAVEYLVTPFAVLGADIAEKMLGLSQSYGQEHCRITAWIREQIPQIRTAFLASDPILNELL